MTGMAMRSASRISGGDVTLSRYQQTRYFGIQVNLGLAWCSSCAGLSQSVPRRWIRSIQDREDGGKWRWCLVMMIDLRPCPMWLQSPPVCRSSGKAGGDGIDGQVGGREDNGWWRIMEPGSRKGKQRGGTKKEERVGKKERKTWNQRSNRC